MATSNVPEHVNRRLFSRGAALQFSLDALLTDSVLLPSCFVDPGALDGPSANDGLRGAMDRCSNTRTEALRAVARESP